MSIVSTQRKMGTYMVLLLFLFFVGINTVATLTPSLTLTYGDQGLEGTAVDIRCSWTVEIDEVVSSATLYYSTITETNQLIKLTPGNSFGYGSKFDQNRMNVTTGPDYIDLRIQSIQCTDEVTYLCSIDYNLNNNISPAEVISSPLEMRVQPTEPTLSGVTETTFAEGDGVVATCNAVVGSPGKGKLHWRIYRDDVAEDLLDADSRISTSIPVTDNCRDTLSSTLTLTLDRDYQDLVITCFVVNTDFNPEATLPTVCEENDNYCVQTQKITIVYAVSQDTMILQIDPDTVFQGGTATLTCAVDGFPVPDYTWTKGNETLTDQITSVTVDGVTGSRLVVDNLSIEMDSGIYNCTASHEVQGIQYSSSMDIDIVIAETPPPTTLPPTTPETTGSTDGGSEASTGGGGDDNTVIIVVVVVVILVFIIVAVVAVVLWRRRNAKGASEEEPRKATNTGTNNLAFVNGGQPDLVADDKYRTPSLNNSFDIKNEDGLMYADLTYDNRPRSRKPLAIGDNASDYSDIHMPHV